MSKLRKVLTNLVLLDCLIVCSLLFSLLVSAPSVQARTMHYCPCVEYVNSYYGMHVPGDAYQWIANLPYYGWHQEPVGTIRIGDIAVWDQYAMPTVGHVAIVSRVSDSSQGATITFLGANQYGSRFNSLQCNDVNYWQDPSEWNSAVFFYR